MIDVKLDQEEFEFLYKCGVKNYGGADLSTLNLSRMQLHNCNFSGAKLNDCDLKYTNFTNSKLVGTNLSNADIRGTNFEKSTIVDAQTKKVLLDIDTNWKGCDAISSSGERVFTPNSSIRFTEPRRDGTPPKTIDTTIGNLLKQYKSVSKEDSVIRRFIKSLRDLLFSKPALSETGELFKAMNHAKNDVISKSGRFYFSLPGRSPTFFKSADPKQPNGIKSTHQSLKHRQ